MKKYLIQQKGEKIIDLLPNASVSHLPDNAVSLGIQAIGDGSDCGKRVHSFFEALLTSSHLPLGLHAHPAGAGYTRLCTCCAGMEGRRKPRPCGRGDERRGMPRLYDGGTALGYAPHRKVSSRAGLVPFVRRSVSLRRR
jgi:hypothetical protein